VKGEEIFSGEETDYNHHNEDENRLSPLEVEVFEI